MRKTEKFPSTLVDLLETLDPRDVKSCTKYRVFTGTQGGIGVRIVKILVKIHFFHRKSLNSS